MASGVALAERIDDRFEADGPWPLPDGWMWAEAQSFADVVGGGTPSNAADPGNFDADGVPWITPADLSGYSGSTIRKGARSLSAMGLQRSSTQMLPAGSVLISSRAPVGYCVVAEVPVCTNQGFKSLQLKGPIDPFFIRYFVLYARRRLNDAASGTTFKELSGRAMERIVFPLAPVVEQRRIVKMVDALFAEIAEGEAALAAARKGLDTFRRALLKAAVTGELTKDWRTDNPATETGHDLLARIAEDRATKAPAKGRGRRNADAPPPDSATLPELPDGWAWGTLDALSWASSYGTSVKCAQDASGIAVLRIPNIREGEIVYGDLKFATTELSLEPSDFVAPGDLLVIRTNGSETLIGRGGVCYLKPDQPTYLASYLIRFRLLGGELMWRWVSKFFESPPVRQWMTRQIASSAGQYNVSQSNLASLLVPVPPASEMAEILWRVSDALAAAADTLVMLDAEAADATRLKQSILKAAFEGRLVLQDPTDEPASTLLARQTASPTAIRLKRGRGRKSTA